jgi:hypothetical protein
VLLEGFIPGSHAVVLDMQVLASTVDLGDAAASDCSSGPAELGCTKPFAALGIDFASGQAIGTPGLVRLTKIE